MEEILSVGIDIGTSTTQVIFSRLRMENTSGYFSVPHVSIVDKEVVYRSDIVQTPLLNESMIDVDRVREIVAQEFQKAGFTPADTKSGAVIITGESARKENADAVLQKMSDFAGEFVVSAAGPDLESEIAGKGSGAYQYSMDHHCCVINLDIGGGTTNIVAFEDGRTIGRGCYDIGGRLIRVSKDLIVEYISPAAAKVADAVSVQIQVGRQIRKEELDRITDEMARLLGGAIGMVSIEPAEEQILKQIQTAGSTAYDRSVIPEYLFFSGGVADAIYERQQQDFPYGDIGVLLGASIRREAWMNRLQSVTGTETIRATVVGAGTYTTTISGSTITYTSDIFPIRNVPVLKLSTQEETACMAGDAQILIQKLEWFLGQTDAAQIAIAMTGTKNPEYGQIQRLAKSIREAVQTCLPAGLPVILILEEDMAKALGQQIYYSMDQAQQIVCIDGILVEENDFIDLGKPLLDGMVIPVVVKTLLFG